MVLTLNWHQDADCEALAAYFVSLPAQHDREYELSITKTAEVCPEEVFGLCRELLADRSRPQEVRFAAAHVLATHFRRFKSYTEFAHLIDAYGPEFSKQPMYPHLAALMYSGRGAPGDIEQALELSRIAAHTLTAHPGALHAFANNVTTSAEAGGAVDPELLEEARKALSVAIGLEPAYAKFHCTRGRLLALGGDFTGAQGSIQKAMDLEDEHKSDYALRLGEYQHHLARVFIAEMRTTLEREYDLARKEVESTRAEMLQQLDDLRAQNMTTLGLFTAILSFTLASLQIVQGQSFDQAARLIVVMAGAILVVYGLFTLMLRRAARGGSWPMIAMSAAGVVVVVAALVWG